MKTEMDWDMSLWDDIVEGKVIPGSKGADTVQYIYGTMGGAVFVLRHTAEQWIGLAQWGAIRTPQGVIASGYAPYVACGETRDDVLSALQGYYGEEDAQ